MADVRRTTERRSWRVSTTESARLTPDGALIESEGFLPLRVRVSESTTRAAFPGTLVRLGERPFEVAEERVAGDGAVRYELRDWPADQAARQRVEYGPGFLRPVLAERRRLADRERSRWWSWLLYPLLGLLPEERQIQECDRYGLEPRMATFSSGTFEAMLAITMPRWGADIALGAIAWPWGGTAAARAIFGLLFGEVAGSPLVGLARPVARRLAHPGPARDLTVLPLTRTAFWSRLARPDKLTQEEGAWSVDALLPHLDWEAGHQIEMNDEFWRVTPLPASYQRGRLTHRYRLVPAAADGPKEPEAPDPLFYQRSVLQRVTREWDKLMPSFVFRWLVSLLPGAAQARALEGRDPARARSASRATCAVTAGLGLWFATGAGAFNWLTGLVLFADAAQRLPGVLAGRPAPSWFGALFSDYLPPERDEYIRHRDAERSALEAGTPAL